MPDYSCASLLVAEPGELLDEYIDISSLLLNCGQVAFFLLVFWCGTRPASPRQWPETDHGSLLLLMERLLASGDGGHC